MKKKWTYKQQFLVYFTGVFIVFAAFMVLFQLGSERRYKEEILQSRLSAYSDIIAQTEDHDAVMDLLPAELRVTVMDKDGTVVFDSRAGADTLDNHLMRPEVQQAIVGSEAFSIRVSDTMGIPYFYFSKSYGGFIVRVALPYEVDVKRFFQPDIFFLVLAFSLFVVALFSLIFLSDHFGEGISRQLEKSNNMVALEKEKNKTMKQQMTNNIAHELRTPVTSIRGYLETIISCPDLPQERRQVFIDRAYAQTLRLSDLIRDIAIITKIEEAPEQLKKEPVNLKSVADEIFEEARGELEKRNITVENILTDDLLINGNPSLIYAIFRNLVENSMKYAGDGVKIHLECSETAGDRLLLTYYDTGKGVGEEHLTRIFERFYRVSEGRTRDDGGSGLGLSIVRNAIAFHGGDIQARNRAGGGLEFIFSLSVGF